ncbi:Lysine-specific demethylase 5B [Echinococcus granulosus]|nr:Lysine-specific demethylase 5B [Echinococcus granulosus]
MNGTYVNYIRVSGGVTLKSGDIVCFGHLNGANLKPGDDVTPFFSDLKYQVYIGSPKEVAAATAEAGESNSERVSANKRQRKSSGGSHDVKKAAVTSSKTPSRHRGGDDAVASIKSEAEDSDEDLMDRLSKRKSNAPSGGNTAKKNSSSKSNGMKKHASPPPSATKKSKHHSKKSRAREMAVDAEDDGDDVGEGDSAAGGDNEDVTRYGEDDQEECSARTCKKPAGTAIDWIQCDKCSKWYHQICLNLTPEEADVDVYYCPSCTKKR